MAKPKPLKEDYNQMYDDLEIVDAFLYGIEITGKDDVYSIRQRLFKLKTYLVRKL